MCSNLKELRIKNNLTQKQLALNSNLSVVTIRKIEKGDIKNMNLRVKNLKDIAKALNVTVLDLLDEE